jgi:mRNA interferase YafQ
LDGATLPEKFRDHKLQGNFAGCRKCHIEPDWLLIYRIVKNEVIFERTGTHSDLFKK